MHDPEQFEPAVTNSSTSQASSATRNTAGNLQADLDFRPWLSAFGTVSDQALGMLAYEGARGVQAAN